MKKDIKKHSKAKDVVKEILSIYKNEDALQKERNLFRQTKDSKYRKGFNDYHKLHYNQKLMKSIESRYEGNSIFYLATQDAPPPQDPNGHYYHHSTNKIMNKNHSTTKDHFSSVSVISQPISVDNNNENDDNNNRNNNENDYAYNENNDDDTNTNNNIDEENNQNENGKNIYSYL